VFKYELKEDRKPLQALVEHFFPLLTQIVEQISASFDLSKVHLAHLLCKIFNDSNFVSL